MKKYLFIAALIIGNNTWTMHSQEVKTEKKPVEIKKTNPTNTNYKKSGQEILDDINAHSGIRTNQVAHSTTLNPSTLFILQSKL